MEDVIRLNEEEREKLKEFLKENLEIILRGEDKKSNYIEATKIKEKKWKDKFENQKYYKNIKIIGNDISKEDKNRSTTTYPAFLGFKHLVFGENMKIDDIYPSFYLYTNKNISNEKYLILAFGTSITTSGIQSSIYWDNSFKDTCLDIYDYFKHISIEVKESFQDTYRDEVSPSNDKILVYNSYIIEDDLKEHIKKITDDFEKILNYYISYIELYKKYKDRIKNDEEIKEKDLKEILEYYIESKENTPEEKDECNKEIKEYNKKFFGFSKTIQKFDHNFYFPLNTILYGTSKIKDIMCSIICCSIYIIQRKFVEDKTNLESFKGHFLNGLIKYIPSDEEYSLKEFEEFCNKVKEDKYNNNYVLIFENIDKRDKSKIFGEDFSKLKERICNKEDSELPKNLYILATTSKTSFHIEDIEFFKNFDFEKIDSNDEYIKNIGEMDEEIKEIFKINKKDFKFPLNTILYGPPGTGKTYNSIFYSVGIIKKDKSIIDIIEDKTKNISDIEKEEIFDNFNDFKEQGQIEFITFHQSYSYEDFIEGIRPTLATKDSEDNKDLKYTIHSGIFKKICERARNDKDKNYVLIIDEINRGNISKIFGELITLLEPSKRLGETEELKIRLAYSGEEFGVPKNLYILGTMNTADRSIALLDIALRRRFNFIEMPPRYELLKQKIEVKNDKIELQELLKAINTRIEFLLDKDHLIGHSYFINIKTFEDLKEIFRNSIIPLLQEYFYDDFEKIREVLNIGDNNDSFIIKKEIPQNFSDTLKTRFQNKPVYVINETEIEDKGFNSHQNYTKIYN
ncbi:McrB family protein [Fusobacterium periodonticum]|uniref:McrB family protein n=1 Tax=Fusobacterium periodonticum TaxID=860 RepID=UPI001A5ACAE7|nr:AAA family ATPase [Fusobacterium periodonticum]VTX89939.1 5-methylcytosine-specific restriction enzyme B [Fusobacterium periodonticum]